MAEHQEIYRYAVDRECAMQQRNMTNGVFDTVAPHLETAAQAIEQKTPGFLAAPDDPIGLKLYNLHLQTRELSRNVAEVSGLLAQLAGKDEA